MRNDRTEALFNTTRIVHTLTFTLSHTCIARLRGAREPLWNGRRRGPRGVWAWPMQPAMHRP